MSHKFVIPLLGLVTLVTACAAPQPTWRKAGVSADDTVSALSECKYQIGLNKIPEAQQKEMLGQCMQAKGFRWRTH
jgi:hypothetical protein|tara:strand:- start:389 stop:616 length:228 start_codon:yes stop_codon:yes gene_type:complete